MLLELLAYCTVHQPQDTTLQMATFMFHECYFNGLWTIVCLLQPPQQFKAISRLTQRIQDDTSREHHAAQLQFENELLLHWEEPRLEIPRPG